jgi:hypothetical protein
MRLSTLTVVRFMIFAAAVVSLCYGQNFRFSLLSEAIVQQREEDPPDGLQERETRIKQLFTDAGCASDRLSEQPLATGTNVICRLAGKGKGTIIVGANYNPARFDNWTGASLLPSLFQSLRNRKRHHTFIFVAFADGDDDLAGSKFFAQQMPQAEVERTAAMVNLDALGFSLTKFSSNGSDKKLVTSFVTVMYALKQMGSQVDISRAVRLDSEPFASRQIPQITIHSLMHDEVTALEPVEQPLVAAPNDDFAHIEAGFHSNFYYSSYQLISGYLAFLDETLKLRKGHRLGNR